LDYLSLDPEDTRAAMVVLLLFVPILLSHPPIGAATSSFWIIHHLLSFTPCIPCLLLLKTKQISHFSTETTAVVQIFRVLNFLSHNHKLAIDSTSDPISLPLISDN
jgi:hypothetical protein